MKPYGLKYKGVDCCPGHTPWPAQSKYSNKVGGRRAGRRYFKRKARAEGRREMLEELLDLRAPEEFDPIEELSNDLYNEMLMRELDEDFNDGFLTRPSYEPDDYDTPYFHIDNYDDFGD